MSHIAGGGNFLTSKSYIGNTAGGVAPFTCNYVTEDGLAAYVAEDGTTFYVPVACYPPQPFGPAFNMVPSLLGQGGNRWRMI